MILGLFSVFNASDDIAATSSNASQGKVAFYSLLCVEFPSICSNSAVAGTLGDVSRSTFVFVRSLPSVKLGLELWLRSTIILFMPGEESVWT